MRSGLPHELPGPAYYDPTWRLHDISRIRSTGNHLNQRPSRDDLLHDHDNYHREAAFHYN